MIMTHTPPTDLYRQTRSLLIGESRAIRQVRALIARLALSSASVLITGPSGSGKEVIARALHQLGRGADSGFVAVNCAAIPRDLFEAELFGHEKGAFTGATMQRRGRFELADGGTLFLDEIGDMPLDMQAKLLRVLEERSIERIGGATPIAVDARIVSATHHDLEALMDRKLFRDDLYYRVAVFPLHLPGLAERREDIAPLAHHFAARGGGGGNPEVSFSAGAVAALEAHDWPGNVRELRNVIERAAILYPRRTLSDDDIARVLPRNGADALDYPQPVASWQPAVLPRIAAQSDPHGVLDGGAVDLRAYLGDMERDFIIAALDRAGDVVAEAARLLGLQRTTLVEKMRKYGIDRRLDGDTLAA